jgi:hypothetical protein
MGTFPTPLPPTSQHISTINMISTMAYQSYESSDPWIVPSPLEFDALGDTMPLSPAEASYDAIQSTSPSPDDQHLLASTAYSFPSWLDSLSSTFDYILQIFPSDESIMEMLSIEEAPWDDNHHHSSFLPSLDEIEKDIHSIFPDRCCQFSPISNTHPGHHLQGEFGKHLFYDFYRHLDQRRYCGKCSSRCQLFT